MPCRAARACRPVLQGPSQYLWITDEVLADAVDRFTRAFGECRRYGSNVPGPLEARRRSAKRRMGLATHAASASPAPEIGSLFGLGAFGSSRRQDFDKSWKWEAPTGVPKQQGTGAQNDTTWKYGWLGGAPRRKESAWEQFLEMPQHVEVDPVDESKRAFEELLAGKQNTGSVSSGDMTEVQSFLQSSADEPAAHNIARLMDWIGSREIEDEVYTQLSTFLSERLQAVSLDLDEIAHILVSAAVHERPNLLGGVLSHSLSHSSPERTAQLCRLTTRMLLDLLRPDPELTAPSPVLLWLQCLKQSEHLPTWLRTCKIWRGIYRELALTYRSPAAISAHLTSLTYRHLSHVLLTHWVPHILPDCKASSHTGTMTIPSKMHDLDHPAPKATSLEDLEKAFELRQRTKITRRATQKRRNNPLLDLLIVLDQHGVPLKSLARDIFDIFCQQSPDITFKFFRHVWFMRFLDVDQEFAVSLVKHFLEKEQVMYAYRVFNHVKGLPLSRCYELPLKLAATRLISPGHIWNILRRQAPPDYVETTARTRPILSLVPEHIDLIHLVAWKWAMSPHLSNRIAYRRVWQCYRFLLDRGAPISSTMTRAMVTAGVARPLLHHRRPGAIKFRYILGLVRKYEGEDVADALDRAVYIQWNERVMSQGLNSLQRAIGDHMGETIDREHMDELRFRVKLWSKGRTKYFASVKRITLVRDLDTQQGREAMAQPYFTKSLMPAVAECMPCHENEPRTGLAAKDAHLDHANAIRNPPSATTSASPARSSAGDVAAYLPIEDTLE